jgi:hypothetical protein
VSLARTIKNLKKGEQLVITPRIDTWLRQNPEGVVFNEQTIDLIRQITKGNEANSKREGRFGASSRGTCQRRQVFAYLGLPQTGALDPVLVNLFNDGKWRHMRWQLMGMQAGVFTHIEHPISVPQLRLKISLDALNADEGWFCEVKGASDYANKVLSGVPEAHNLQMHTCMLATGWDMCVYIVEDKRSQEWREVIVRKDPVIYRAVKRELALLNESVEYQRLPGVLPACEAGQGPYKACPYRGHCLDQKYVHGDEWPDEGWPGV